MVFPSPTLARNVFGSNAAFLLFFTKHHLPRTKPGSNRLTITLSTPKIHIRLRCHADALYLQLSQPPRRYYYFQQLRKVVTDHNHADVTVRSPRQTENAENVAQRRRNSLTRKPYHSSTLLAPKCKQSLLGHASHFCLLLRRTRAWPLWHTAETGRHHS